MTDQQYPVCATLSDETLSAFADGDLPPAEAARVRAHLVSCAACAAATSQLGALAAAARRLDRPEPPPTLWLAVEGALEKHDRPWWMSLRIFGVGALAGAAAVSVAALGLASWRTHRAERAERLLTGGVAAPAAVAARVAADPLLDEAEAELARAAAAYEQSIEKLRALLEREEPRWSPDERTRCAERLAQLDEAIAHSRDLARRSPGDTLGNDQLFAAYRQKIAFLAEAVHRGGTFRQTPPEPRP
ncbi:MAG TPA: zf-HC2 domain-containing protein [Polyangia bacterium]|nr:zf-HC2 domain-containing protein [Polyangia bacterium]